MLGIEVGRAGEELGKVRGRRWFLEKGVLGGGEEKMDRCGFWYKVAYLINDMWAFDSEE